MPITENDNNPRRRPLREREIESDDFKPSPFSMESIRRGFGQGLFMKIVLGLLIFIFAAGFLFAGLVGRLDQSLSPSGAPRSASGNASAEIAMVGDEKIERAKFENAATQQENQMAQFGQTTGPAEYFMSRRQMLQQFIGSAASLNAARAAGIEATPQEIDARIDKELGDFIAQKKQAGEANFRRDLEARGSSESQMRDELKATIDRDAVAKQVVLDKFEKGIKDQTNVTEADYQKSQTRLDLRQIVIRPKLPDAKEKDLTAARAKNAADAKTRAEGIAAQLKKAPASTRAALFATLAKTSNDDTFNKAKGGALGSKLPAELQLAAPLRQALTDSPSDLVGPLQDEATGDNYIFFIASRKFSPPADYAKKKAETLKAFQTQRAQEAWDTFQSKITRDAEAKVEISDPALKAFDLTSTQATKPGADVAALKAQAASLYEGALPSARGAQAAAIRYQLAQLYKGSNQPAKAVEQLQQIVKADGSVPMRLELARALQEGKKNPEAIAQLQAASKDLTANPPQPSMFGGNPADAQHLQIAQAFSQLGRADLAAAERKLVKPVRPGGGMGGMNGLPPGVQMMPQGGASTR